MKSFLKNQLLSGISHSDVERLLKGEHSDPHFVLGAHPNGDNIVIRAYHPDAVKVEVLLKGKIIPMEKVYSGLFAAMVKKRHFSFDYKERFYFADGNIWERRDPYCFWPTLGELDLYLIRQGRHLQLYQKLGAHPMVHQGVKGVAFAVWAPNALRVSVIGDFNQWDGRIYPMRVLGESGIWEIFIPDIEEGALYKYEIKTKNGDLRIKTDPLAFYMEKRPKNASIIWDINKYEWQDGDWIEKRKKKNIYCLPLNIYEIHLGSWQRGKSNRFLNYREIAPRLVNHVKKYGFTHIELLPIMEHPHDASWGYQVSGYYAPTSRYGNPDDFRYFVDYCHQHDIGVILDWVPGHFPKDDYSLRLFDGTALYEHADPRLGEHPDWQTLVFNFGRNEVRNFLIANALFWLKEYHIDALRVDAVASMLYLDYSRKPGEWIPNKYGGNENLEAIAFLQELNKEVYSQCSGCFTIAEESTAWPGVSRPVYLGGLGFGFKWNMGWMHDTLFYFSKDPIYRKWHHNQMTFSMLYAYTENFILPLSHDEVVHGKGSLYQKMPGDKWQKLANLRVLFTYMYTHPGKKLVFMGNEIAQEREWDHLSSIDWHLLNDPDRKKFNKFFQDLCKLYLENPPLWKRDHSPNGFQWIDCHDSNHSVFSYIRRDENNYLICVLNLTPIPRFDYRIGVPDETTYLEIFNSDSEYYGGSNLGNLGMVKTDPIPAHGFPFSLNLILPPLAALILKPM
ncbi:MAG TPA: 1,4-alpha-glucan branching protein GlgB [Candidatus Desulfofervidus auxilii]|uniref:1,4-alpha-glucan branching enzyme GlgB n=1 Tax=Desulfofervidus auxilii TaxID=1621989 RepID=A0A7V0NEN6_DESA2|nr:1,4-alpha-glucan branching protein GlgB [Candidatus Desulfofervidus auxilii]